MAKMSDSQRIAELYDRVEIQTVIAELLRAIGARNSVTVAELVLPDANVLMYLNKNGTRVLNKQPMSGADMVTFIRDHYAPYAPGEWGHVMNTDTIIKVNGSNASYSGQLIYLRSASDPEPLGGYPEKPLKETKSLGTVTVTGCGLYEMQLKKVSNAWKISEVSAIVDLPWPWPKNDPLAHRDH